MFYNKEIPNVPLLIETIRDEEAKASLNCNSMKFSNESF